MDKYINARLDPAILFAFLESWQDYPTTGYRLAEEAKRQGCENDMVLFFETLPGEVADEEEILRHARASGDTPFNFSLDVESASEEPNGSDQLRIEDIR